ELSLERATGTALGGSGAHLSAETSPFGTAGGAQQLSGCQLLQSSNQQDSEAAAMGNGSTRKGLQRLPTGVDGLDTVLGGGLFRGVTYIVQGPPGVGKTILGNQCCFHQAA